MREVCFLDLKRVNQLNASEIQTAVQDVLDSGRYIMGKKVRDFEHNMAESLGHEGFAVGCNSGTDALALSLLANHIGANDEVITVSHTAIPTIAAIISVGAVPVFVDVDVVTWVMDTYKIAEKVTKKTKAIICVHLYGNMVDIDAVRVILRDLHREDIIVIEDVAQAQGASFKGRQAGTLGDIGAFSFYPSKNIGALGDGGAVFTRDEKIKDKLLMYRNYGQKDRYHALMRGGINSRLDEIQAVILSVKLQYLHSWNAKKAKLMELYRKELAGFPLTFQEITQHSMPAWHLCVIALDEDMDRDLFMKGLLEKGIQTLIHYPHPTHQQEAFCQYEQSKLEVTESLAKRIVSLPFHYAMDEEEILYISSAIKQKFVRRK